MIVLGQLCLFSALIAAGYASFACIAGSRLRHAGVTRSGSIAGLVSLAALTVATGVLVEALLTNDLRFRYVTQYGSPLLPSYFSLSALWVGQAGSLLFWAWLSAIVALAFRWSTPVGTLREMTFGILMVYLGFLVAMLVFAADPMQPNIIGSNGGDGLSPILQHVQMLFHPPVVFLGYAAWGVPFALALASLTSGQPDDAWVHLARPWTLLAWTLLGVGILLGAVWAYEELGWGGYWSWDPVENGSLIPWLAGTALIHCGLAWRRRGVLKKTTLVLAITVFALCNFAAFLTRSGIFSSLHEFSRSSIGWMFLGAMGTMAVGTVVLIARRHSRRLPQQTIESLWSREAVVLIATVALLLLAGAILVGTLSVPLSQITFGSRIVVGQGFYNNVLIPTGLLVLAAMAVSPLLRWGTKPARLQKRALLAASVISGLVITTLLVAHIRQPVALTVGGLSALAAAALFATLYLDLQVSLGSSLVRRLLSMVAARRQQYAGFTIHLGAMCLIVGIAGSSLGTRQLDAILRAGESIDWAGRSIRFVKMAERETAGKRIAEVELEIADGGRSPYILRPAQELYRSDDHWRVKVAIHSIWSGDFYVILHRSEGTDLADFTFLENPLMRWLWLSGWIMALGALAAVWPTRYAARQRRGPPVPRGDALPSLRSAGPSARRSGE